MPSRRPLRGTRLPVRDADHTARTLSSATSTQPIGVDARHGFNAQQVGQPGGAFTNFGFFHPPTGLRSARPTLRRRSRRPRSHCHRVAALAALYVVDDHLPLEHRFAPSFATPVVDAARGSPLELRRRDRDPGDATATIATSLTPLNQS